jgi:hypothetical protein
MWARVYDEQRVAFLDNLAFAKQNLLDSAADEGFYFSALYR